MCSEFWKNPWRDSWIVIYQGRIKTDFESMDLCLTMKIKHSLISMQGWKTRACGPNLAHYMHFNVLHELQIGFTLHMVKRNLDKIVQIHEDGVNYKLQCL